MSFFFILLFYNNIVTIVQLTPPSPSSYVIYMGKFDKHKYWKHEDCMDAFISVKSVAFDDDDHNSILNVDWCVQGTAQWWFTPSPTQRIKITPSNYNKWKRHNPLFKDVRL